MPVFLSQAQQISSMKYILSPPHIHTCHQHTSYTAIIPFSPYPWLLPGALSPLTIVPQLVSLPAHLPPHCLSPQSSHLATLSCISTLLPFYYFLSRFKTKTFPVNKKPVSHALLIPCHHSTPTVTGLAILLFYPIYQFHFLAI